MRPGRTDHGAAELEAGTPGGTREPGTPGGTREPGVVLTLLLVLEELPLLVRPPLVSASEEKYKNR